MTCIKTGANVHFDQYGVTVHGDLFKVGNCYLFQFTQGGFYNGKSSEEAALKADATFHICDDSYLHKDRGVCVVNERYVELAP